MREEREKEGVGWPGREDGWDEGKGGWDGRDRSGDTGEKELQGLIGN
jgi:hypothetical protein